MNKTSTTSSRYTLSYLAMHPKSKEIVYRHLRPLITEHGVEPALVSGTLQSMFDYNMGGGIPYEIIVSLMEELDALKLPLRPNIDENTISALAWATLRDVDKKQRQNAAKKYLPNKIECLFVAEAPPAGQRYFYFEESNEHDGLFINIMRAIYKDVAEISVNEIRSRKVELLERFKENGFYLLDALDYRLSSSVPNTFRKALIASNVPDIEKRLSKLPNHDHFTYFIKGSVFDALHSKDIKHIGHPYNTALPFPSNGNQTRFKNALRKALSARKFIWRNGDIDITNKLYDN